MDSGPWIRSSGKTAYIDEPMAVQFISVGQKLRMAHQSESMCTKDVNKERMIAASFPLSTVAKRVLPSTLPHACTPTSHQMSTKFHAFMV
jgi:hypothetical protein